MQKLPCGKLNLLSLPPLLLHKARSSPPPLNERCEYLQGERDGRGRGGHDGREILRHLLLSWKEEETFCNPPKTAKRDERKMSRDERFSPLPPLFPESRPLAREIPSFDISLLCFVFRTIGPVLLRFVSALSGKRTPPPRSNAHSFPVGLQLHRYLVRAYNKPTTYAVYT